MCACETALRRERVSMLSHRKPCAQGFFNNQRLVAPSAAFHWQARWGGAEVFVTGDWCAWAVREPPPRLRPFQCVAACF